MRSSTMALLSERPGAGLRRITLVAIVAAVVYWVADAAFDAAVAHDEAFVDELLHPRLSELLMRLVVAALATLVYRVAQDRRRLYLMSSALEAAGDGIQITDLDGHIAYSNRAVQEIYGFSPAQLHGLHVSSMNVDPDVAGRVILPAIQQAGRWTGELEVRHKDGHAFPVWLTTSLVTGVAGRPIAAVGVIRDITARKRAEQQLRDYAAKLEETTRLKELFSDILRHDLLGPATALRVTIDLLARRDASPVTARLVGQMRRSCANLTDLIEMAAKYARISALGEIELQDLDLRSLLEGLVADFDVALQDRGARISFAPAGALPVRANRLVREIFANLLSNAVKYGPQGGIITIEVEDAGAEWIASVADRGEGIPPDDRERIFTRFERLERGAVKGTGLGLAIAKHVVELHRGRIWVEENPGGGSVFRVALPKATDGAAPASGGGSAVAKGGT